MRNIPHGLMHFKTLSLADGAVWEGYGTFRRQSLARRGRVLGVGDLAPLPVCFLLLCVVEDMVSQVPCLAFPAIMGLPL